MDGDTANGVHYTTEERDSWKWAGSQWVDVKSAFEFKTRIGLNPYPGVAERAYAGALGPRIRAGLAELDGFAGDLASLKSYAVTSLFMDDVPTMVSGVNLKEADYLGPVPGILHLQSDNGHGHEHCIEGPGGVHLEPVSVPLWIFGTHSQAAKMQCRDRLSAFAPPHATYLALVVIKQMPSA
jgi:hypothetical protein